jgi:hypothetical protein
LGLLSGNYGRDELERAEARGMRAGQGRGGKAV